MLCGENPCVCNKPAPKAKAKAPAKAPKEKPLVVAEKPAPVIVPATEKTPKIDVASAMKAQASKNVYTKVHVVDEPVVDEAVQWSMAVRALAPILHPDERVKYFADIMGVPTLAERRTAWKARRK